MSALMKDLGCIDAHAHLGNLEFDDSPEMAMNHYEIGIRIGCGGLMDVGNLCGYCVPA